MRRTSSLARLLWTAVACASLGATALACHSKVADPKTPIGSDDEDAKVARNGLKNRTIGPAAVDAHLVASLSDRTLGPFMAQRGAVGMVMYIGTVEDGSRSLVAAPLDGDANAKGEPLRVMPIKDDASKLVVKPTGGANAGFVAAWSAITERGEAVYLAGVSDDGKLRSTATELSHTSDHVMWLDVVPTAAGAVCLWAEETRSGGASLFAAAIDPDGKLRGSPSRVVRGVKAWQTVATSDGVGLALVMPIDARNSALDSELGGSLSFLRLDASAHAIAAPVVITAKPEVGADVDVVATKGDSYIFAWTDLGEGDPYVALAGIDARGKVTPTTRAVTAPTGGSSLVALEAGSSGIALAWDEPVKRARSMRRVHVERIDDVLGNSSASSTSVADIAFDFAGTSNVELAAEGDGFALLATARACETSAAPTPLAHCSDNAIPTFLRLDKSLQPRQVEPMRMEADRVPAALAWNLACTKDHCDVLTVDAASPAKVRAVDLPLKDDDAYQAPIAPTAPTGAAHVTSLSTLAAGATYTQVVATRLGQMDKPKSVLAPAATVASGASVAPEATTLVATLATNGDPNSVASEGTLTVIPVDDKGTPTLGAPPVTIRAVLSHGLAIAPAGRAEDGAALAWVARDAGDLQVHVSRVDRKGRRVNDVMLTSAKGDASDVAIAWSNGGWLVAWVDSRDGNGEVYTTKVGLDLARIAREERITNAPGDASDLTIFAPARAASATSANAPAVVTIGTKAAATPAQAAATAATSVDDAWIAWADPREDEANGTSDVYYARIHSRDAKKDGNEVRALASAAHSRSPVFASAGDAGGAMLAWIEDAPLGADPTVAGAHGAMLLAIDANGRPHGDPERLRAAADGFATAIAIEATDSGGLRAVLARSLREDLTLDVLEIGSSHASTRATPLVTLDAPSSFDVTLNLAGGALYFDDDGAPSRASAIAPVSGNAHSNRPDGDRRVRRAAISWTR